MKTKFNILFYILFIIIINLPALYSQEKPSSHIFEMNFLSFNYEQMDEFLKLYEVVGKPLDAQNEYVISTKILRHVTGPNWTLCLITEYKDLESFALSQKRGDEIFEKTFPDKSQRDEIIKKYTSFMNGHTDALVRSNPSLEKAGNLESTSVREK